MSDDHLIFVYGTLKQGDCRSSYLAGQRYVGTAETTPDYRLYHLGSYPGLVDAVEDGNAVQGEVYRIDLECLKVLDEVEGTAEGLYERKQISLRPPFESCYVEGYFYLGSLDGCVDLGCCWDIPAR